MTSLTVQFGASPSSRISLRSTIWPWMWRNAIASPIGDQTGRPRCPVVGQALELPAVGGIEDHEVVPEAAGLGRDDVAAIRRERRFEVARPGQRSGGLLRHIEAVDDRRPACAGAVVPDVEEDLAVRSPGRVLVSERRGLRDLRDGRLLRGQVVELEDDVALRRVRAIRDHRERRAVGRHDGLPDPGVPGPPVDVDPAAQDPDRVLTAVGLDLHDARGRQVVIAQDVRRRPAASPAAGADEVDRGSVGRPGRHRVVAALGQLLDVLACLDPDVARLRVDDRALEGDDLGRDDDDVRRSRRRRGPAVPVAVAVPVPVRAAERDPALEEVERDERHDQQADDRQDRRHPAAGRAQGDRRTRRPGRVRSGHDAVPASRVAS